MSYASYREIPVYIKAREPFRGNSCYGAWTSPTTYAVFSYSTMIAEYDDLRGVWSLDETYYSRTTSRLQNIIRRTV